MCFFFYLLIFSYYSGRAGNGNGTNHPTSDLYFLSTCLVNLMECLGCHSFKCETSWILSILHAYLVYDQTSCTLLYPFIGGEVVAFFSVKEKPKERKMELEHSAAFITEIPQDGSEKLWFVFGIWWN